MEIGTVLFVIGDSPISKIIQKVDGKFSHVAIAISETEVLEINWNIHSRVVIPDYKKFETVKLNLTATQKEKIASTFNKYIGKRYDFLQIIGLIFNLELNNKRKLICSELVYNILSEVDYLDGELNGDITPNQLYSLLLKEREKTNDN